MVAINTLRKNDLKRLGFSGDVRTMKNDLRELVKNQGWKLRNDTTETLRRKVGAIRLIREVLKQRKIKKNIIASRTRRNARIVLARRLAKESKMIKWVVRVKILVKFMTGETKWRITLRKAPNPTGNSRRAEKMDTGKSDG